MESHTLPPETPAVPLEVLETFVELLSRVEADGSSDAFYSRLCEATCRLAGMDRAVIFRYDDVRRRVRAAGAYGIPLELFADALVTLESAPVARRALVEDRVIEVLEDISMHVPEEYRDLVRETSLVCTPLAAARRWFGVILSDRGQGRPPLSAAERHLLWTLGKTAALASFARLATNQQARARQLQERIDLARDVHESVIQRLFGVQLVFSSQAELSPEARERIGAELQAALVDLRRALQRPLGRSAPATQTTLLEEVERLRREHPSLGLVLTRGSERVEVPRVLEPLAQSVLAEAVRNAHKHATPTRVEVTLDRGDGALMLDVVNDGVRGRARQTGMGLRLAALEALQAGGIVEFGEREPGTWRVRLAVPLDRS
ncbi:MAG TPA: GAF domain-containing protein [Solirubrobacteraceae bacterium]|jgi:signal transduction histidine kinase